MWDRVTAPADEGTPGVGLSPVKAAGLFPSSNVSKPPLGLL